MKKYIWGFVYGVFLTAFMAYVLLDTFVIVRVYTTVPQENVGRTEGEKSPGREASQDLPFGETKEPVQTTPVITENSYEDGLISVVSDGRTRAGAGLSLYELAQFLLSLGAETAYNLDGGGSSSMVFNGKVINNPTTNGRQIKERSVSDIVYIGY